MQDKGGLDAIEREAAEKAAILYRQIDESEGFYSCPVDPVHRSHMNVVFRLRSEALEKAFLAGAESEDLINLKGHRSVGAAGPASTRHAPCRGRGALRFHATVSCRAPVTGRRGTWLSSIHSRAGSSRRSGPAKSSRHRTTP